MVSHQLDANLTIKQKVFNVWSKFFVWFEPLRQCSRTVGCAALRYVFSIYDMFYCSIMAHSLLTKMLAIYYCGILALVLHVRRHALIEGRISPLISGLGKLQAENGLEMYFDCWSSRLSWITMVIALGQGWFLKRSSSIQVQYDTNIGSWSVAPCKGTWDLHVEWPKGGSFWAGSSPRCVLGAPCKIALAVVIARPRPEA